MDRQTPRDIRIANDGAKGDWVQVQTRVGPNRVLHQLLLPSEAMDIHLAPGFGTARVVAAQPMTGPMVIEFMKQQPKELTHA